MIRYTRRVAALMFLVNVLGALVLTHNLKAAGSHRVFVPAVHGTSSAPPAPAPSPPEAPGSLAQQVVILTNHERTKAGCPALSINPKLMHAAQRHSLDMATHNRFDHTGSDGLPPWDRIAAAGYSYRLAGENIAMGQASAAEAVAGWMASPAHRANMLNCAFQEIGVGFARHPGSGNRPFWTQSLAAPK